MSEHQRDEHRYPLELPFGNRLGAIAVLALVAAGGAAALGAARLSERTDAPGIALVAVGGTVAIWALWVLFIGRRRSLVIGAEWIGIPSTITGRTARRIPLADVADADRLHVAGPTGVAGPAVLHLRPSGPGSVSGERVELPVDRLALDDARRASSHLARVLAYADVDTTPSVWDGDHDVTSDVTSDVSSDIGTAAVPKRSQRRDRKATTDLVRLVFAAVIMAAFVIPSASGGFDGFSGFGTIPTPFLLLALFIVGQIVHRIATMAKQRNRSPRQPTE